MRVRAAGVALEVREHSPWAAGKPTVLFVHGYPDQQELWDPVLALLPGEELHLVSYDVRGAGASDTPRNRHGYRTELLLEDLAAVVAATVPDDRRVHLVGHDWGSVQLWDAVNAERGHPRLTGRIASFTAISGPSLDRVPGRHRSRQEQLQQLARSWYIAAFHVPVLPELYWRATAGRATPAMRAQAGGRSVWGPELARNATNGLGLYRANIARRLRHPGVLRTEVPVLVIHPEHDAFLTRGVYDGLAAACTDVRLVELDAGHWVMVSHPQRVAELVLEQVRRCAAP